MKPLVIGGLDIETTGLKQAEGHRIIEVATKLYRYSPDTGAIATVGQFEQRINPGRSIDPAAQAVHHISFEMLEGMPRWEEVAPKVVKLMSACDVIVAHNGDEFDLPFIGNELLRVGQPVPDVRTVDTMVHGRWATPLGKVPNLRELCFATGVDYDPSKAHAALYDVDVMMECFFIGLKGGFYKLPAEMYMGIAA
jgi:DNA polymerase-3 subunit epsilon